MRALLLVGIAACGSAKRTPDAVGNRASPPPRPTCDAHRMAAIAQDLETRWNTIAASVVHCAPGLFPTPGYFLDVDDGHAHRVGVIDTDGVELVPFTIVKQQPVATSVVACATVDLDGDGVDEIVETWSRSAHGQMGSDTWLEVRRIAAGMLLSIRGPHTSVYHPELGSCDAEVRLAGKTIVITVESLSSIPPSDCLTTGTHTFALDRNAIVEIDATKVSQR